MHEPTSEIPKAYEPHEAESKWYRFWSEKGYFRAADTSEKPPYCIVIPPPNVTGALHMGHALTTAIQDLLIRWKRMSGFNALWLPGTDHAGIATQMVVEREIKKTEGKSRHDLGRKEFVERVWIWKAKYGGRIVEQLKVMGASCDWERERFTMDTGLSRAVREAFVRLHEEGLIYRAQRLINWCPRCRTALSDLEVEHEEKSGHLWHIAYPVKGSERSLVVATTRPETMLGDTAVAVHPEDPRYSSLIGQKVVLPLLHREIPVVGDPEAVSMEFGTGAVKVTPAHDFNDYETGKRHGLEMVSIFDLDARTNANAGPYQGLDRKAAREKVLEDLAAQGSLVKTLDHKLAIGVCQRCGDVVEPTLSPQWFVKIAPLAEPAIKAVEEGRTKFVPESWANTYFGWMRNVHDWCISRQLWWGHQIPAWYCTCGEVIVSRDDPQSCPKCGGVALERDEDVLDTWFSSGLWPFSTLGWPERTPVLDTFYPTTVMETGHDIIFFWVARMMMFGLHFMGKVPFGTVFLHAMVRDERGEKMSKVKGNVIDPLDVINGQPKVEHLPPDLKKKFPKGLPPYGADALRFTLVSLTAQGRDIKLSMERVEGYRNFANKIWNASRYALMNLGEAAPVAERLARSLTASPLSLADRWILSRLERTVEETLAALEAYRFNDAASTIYQFVWGEFCDWYIELSKGALYGADEEAKGTTRAVLVFVLDQFLRLLHPLMPYLTEEIWQRLPRRPGDPESIMIAAYPSPDLMLLDARAEEEMATVIAAIDGVRNIRGESNIAPSKKFKAVIHAGPEVRAVLERNRAYLEPLAGLEALEVLPPGHKPRVAATFVHAHMEIFVPLEGVIDLAEEAKRIQKERSKVDADLELLEKKLANPSFAERAPREIVEKDRARIAELKEKRAKLEQGLARLSAEPERVLAPKSGFESPSTPRSQATEELSAPRAESLGAGEVKGGREGHPGLEPSEDAVGEPQTAGGGAPGEGSEPEPEPAAPRTRAREKRVEAKASSRAQPKAVAKAQALSPAKRVLVPGDERPAKPHATKPAVLPARPSEKQVKARAMSKEQPKATEKAKGPAPKKAPGPGKGRTPKANEVGPAVQPRRASAKRGKAAAKVEPRAQAIAKPRAVAKRKPSPRREPGSKAAKARAASSALAARQKKPRASSKSRIKATAPKKGTGRLKSLARALVPRKLKAAFMKAGASKPKRATKRTARKSR
jgi:valyl-tRNA synthetase